MPELLLGILLLPFAAALALTILPEGVAKSWSLAISLLGLALGVGVYFQFNAAQAAQYQMAFAWPWIESFGIKFGMAIDGLSLPLVLLTKLMVPIAILASWKEDRHVKLYMACFLMLDAAMVGTFLATDIFLFYVFWEAMLIPMILLIGVWGSDQRIMASLKFFIFTFAGSVLMLAAIFYLFVSHQEQFNSYTGYIPSLAKINLNTEPLFWGLSAQDLVFLGFTLAFIIKVPLFPFHTWLPDAHVQAPTGGSILLAAVLLKMGTYGLLRFSIPLAPVAFEKFIPLLVALSLIGILYGAWVAFQQTDMKKLVAYSSVSHLGFVVLGICTRNDQGLTGAILQNINHGLSTGALFFLVGVLYERRHTRKFSEYGGLAQVLPWFSVLLVFTACSSMGVPGLNGFIGEFLVLFGAFKANPYWSGVAVLGVIFGALYMLTMVKNILFGPITNAENRGLKDLSVREWAGLLPLVIFIIWLGIAPGFLLKKVENSINTYWSQTQSTDQHASGYGR